MRSSRSRWAWAWQCLLFAQMLAASHQATASGSRVLLRQLRELAVDDDVVGGHVGAEALEDGVTQRASGRDLGKRDLRDQHGFQILHSGRRRPGKRALTPAQVGECAPK